MAIKECATQRKSKAAQYETKVTRESNPSGTVKWGAKIELQALEGMIYLD